MNNLKEEWRCFNLGCASVSLINESSCFSCGYPKGYIDPEIVALFESYVKACKPEESEYGLYQAGVMDYEKNLLKELKG